MGDFLNSQTDGEDLNQRLTERPLIAGGLETPVFSTELAGNVNEIVGRVSHKKAQNHKTQTRASIALVLALATE